MDHIPPFFCTWIQQSFSLRNDGDRIRKIYLLFVASEAPPFKLCAARLLDSGVAYLGNFHLENRFSLFRSDPQPLLAKNEGGPQQTIMF